MVNVLIVDDVEFFRARIASMLKSMGEVVNTFEAGSMPDAVKILENEKIDLMFLDLDLTKYHEHKEAEQNGLEIVRYLQNNNMAIPNITILSGNINASIIKEACAMGITDILVKPPTSTQVLIDRVNAIRFKQ